MFVEFILKRLLTVQARISWYGTGSSNKRMVMDGKEVRYSSRTNWELFDGRK